MQNVFEVKITKNNKAETYVFATMKYVYKFLEVMYKLDSNQSMRIKKIKFD